MHIKICGLTNIDDTLAAVEAGADYLGFNFHPPSPRCITVETCAALVAAVNGRAAGVQTVGIFVHHTVAEAATILEATGLHLAQLHGDEHAEDLTPLAGRAFRAVRDGHTVDFDALAALSPGQPAFLLDANAPGSYGGTGQTADWAAAARVAARYPIFLAGGLTPGNVAAAIRQVRPWGVDVASGVEAAPGRKDAAKMQAFVAAARAAPENKGTQ